jgi:putative SOS response-associated peptidase YedK
VLAQARQLTTFAAMCGRYTLTCPDKIAERFAVQAEIDLVLARYNVAPTQQIPAILDEDPRKLTTLRWGLVPGWAKDEKVGASLINARCETAADKPAFRNAYKQRRCLVPADGFYEWKSTGLGKVPHHFTLKSGGLFAFAGVWESWRRPDGTPVRTVSLMTTKPNALVADVHDRMPVILAPDNERGWLDRSTPVEALAGMLVPYPAEEMKVSPVSSAVSNARCDGPELLRPVAVGDFRLEG